jgi:predicted GNAT superfamily acetyltransferase
MHRSVGAGPVLVEPAQREGCLTALMHTDLAVTGGCRLGPMRLLAFLVRCNISRYHARRAGNVTTFVVSASSSSRSAHHCIIFLRSGRYSAALYAARIELRSV